jgi:hypothetical protein
LMIPSSMFSAIRTTCEESSTDPHMTGPHYEPQLCTKRLPLWLSRSPVGLLKLW